MERRSDHRSLGCVCGRREEHIRVITRNGDTFLTGSQDFSVKEIEVFEIKIEINLFHYFVFVFIPIADNKPRGLSFPVFCE
jgi:hypothetical protein